LVAAKLGARVTLTDNSTRLEVLHYYHPIIVIRKRNIFLFPLFL